MSHSSLSSQDYLILADIVGAYGIKGWVRLRVRLDDPNLLLTLPNLQLASSSKAPSTSTPSVTVQALKRQGKGFIACLDGVTDRTAAEALRGLEIQVATAAFPAAPDDRGGPCVARGRVSLSQRENLEAKNQLYPVFG